MTKTANPITAENSLADKARANSQDTCGTSAGAVIKGAVATLRMAPQDLSQDMVEPTHGEILRAIGSLEGQLKQLLDASRSNEAERSSLGDRVRKLENRMAQVVIVAAVTSSMLSAILVVATSLAPLIWSEIKAANSWRQQQHLGPQYTPPQYRKP